MRQLIWSGIKFNFPTEDEDDINGVRAEGMLEAISIVSDREML